MISPPPNELFTAFSFIGFLMCAIPFYWHFQARNVGTCLYMAWTGLGCLILCIDSIVWNKNMVNRAPVYCDISTRFQIALNSALPACSLCIQRRLYKCTTVTTGGATREEKRRDVVIDLLIGIGIPILQVVAQHVVSGRRYLIFEDYGPAHHTVSTPAAIPLFYAWPVAIGTVSFFYCVMNIYHLYRRKRQFKDMPVISSGSGINRSIYIRLMLLSSVEILGTIPLGSYWISFAVKQGLRKWGSWADVHSHYSVIRQIPSIVWKHNYPSVVGLELTRWSLVLCAFLFFAFFGLAEEAWKHYRLVYTSLANRLGYSTSSNTTCSSNGYAVQLTALA
ncbi:fungal pheromone STE3G-protein-coupled receptor [Lactifluus volemus]|nr:fungal pheromone STE3G-protein-coupled receptor [Lactifluus volemus]